MIISGSKKSWLYLLAFLVPEVVALSVYALSLKEWYIYATSIILFSYIAKKNKQNKLAVASCTSLCMLSIACIVDAYLYGVGTNGETNTIISDYSSYIAICIHACIVYSLIDFNEIRNGVRSTVYSVLYSSCNSYTCDISEYESAECKS